MDFRLTEDQLELRSTLRRYCEDNYPPGTPLEREGWRRLADLDVFRLLVPSERGGLGLELVDAVAVFEVLGEHLVPGPLVWSALGALYVPDLSGGTAIVSGLDGEAASGEPALIEFADELDALVLLRPNGLHLIERAELAPIETVEPTDPLTPVAFARRVPQGKVVADASHVDGICRAGQVLSAALLVGIAERAVRAAVDHAKQRRQFDRPIGSFQAIKHLLADAHVRTLLARSATYAAAAIFDDRDAGDLARAAPGAKLLAADAAIHNARACIQAHGGMGFTWEMIPHYLLKRAWVLENAFGTRAEHGDTMASTLAEAVA